MRKMGKFIARLLGLVAIVATLLLSATAQEEITIKIARIKGQVEVINRLAADSSWTQATTSQLIGSGWHLRTGQGAKVQLVFPLDNVVILKENSILYVDNLDPGGGASLEADEGSLLVNIQNALAPGSDYELKTPTALAVVRGTKYAAVDIDEYDVTFYGYEGDTEIFNSEGLVHLVADTTVEVAYGTAPDGPYPSPTAADDFLADVEDTTEFDEVEAQAGLFAAALARFDRRLDDQREKLDEYKDEWDRYERRDQTTHMVFLYAQVLYVWDEVNELAEEFAALEDAIDEAPDGVGSVSPLPEYLAWISAKLAAIYELLAEFEDDANTVISDNEDVLETLRGLIGPGNPALGLRWGLIDTDNDGVSDVDEIALGLDPMVSNDDGFITLIDPGDGDLVDYPGEEEVTFEFEALDTDLIEAYNLVIEAGGAQFRRNNVDEVEDIDLLPLVGEGGVFFDQIDTDGKVEVQWFIVAEIEEDQLFQAITAANPGFRAGFGANIASEVRTLEIQTPAQVDVIIIDLDAIGPVDVALGDIVRIRGSISEVVAMNQWEIEVVYDTSVLDFDRGRRLGMFATSTVFFGDEPSGVAVVSGVAPRGSGGLTGDGDIFELEFIAVGDGMTTIELEDIILEDVLGQVLDAEAGNDVDIDVTDPSVTTNLRYKFDQR